MTKRTPKNKKATVTQKNALYTMEVFIISGPVTQVPPTYSMQGMGDYPRTLTELEARFSSEEAPLSLSHMVILLNMCDAHKNPNI